MKILILSYYFSPEITPRAFRTSELALQFARSGHKVEVIYPDKGHPGENEFLHENLKLIPVDMGRFKANLFFTGETNSNENSFRQLFRSVFKRILRPLLLRVLPGDKDLLIAYKIFRAITASKKHEVDLLISIGLPFSIHLTSYFAMVFKYIQPKTAIADYGDPYSHGLQKGTCFYGGMLERLVLRKFHQVVVPVDIAISSFDKLVHPSKIKVIPQGFRLDENLHKLNSQPIECFAYAGLFDADIRNPSSFLQHLTQLDTNFVFRLYTDLSNDISMSMISPFISRLGDKMEIYDLLPRKKCIEELSKCKFLINFDNSGGKQVPSKLIDYAISGRPILSIGQKEKDYTLFEDFLSGDYSASVQVDLEQHDIVRVANNFLALTHSK